MPIATLQTQLQQLRQQLELSKSPKQTKVLKTAIARLEEKLKAEAEQAKLKAEAEAKAAQESKRQKDKEAIAQPSPSQTESGKKKRGPRQPKKEQKLKDGTILKAVPGQGQHQLYWKVWGEIQLDENGDHYLRLEGVEHPIPIALGRNARRMLKEQTLPVERFCSLHPVIVDGKIETLQLNACANREKQAELFVAKGYWIKEEETLQIQTNFRYQGKRSQNIFHQIPVKQDITTPETGFRSLQLERDGLNVCVVGELPIDDRDKAIAKSHSC